MNNLKKQTEIKTSLPYCLYKIDTRFFKFGDRFNSKIRFTKEDTTPNRRTQDSKNMEAIRDRWGIEAHSDVLILTDKLFEESVGAEEFALDLLNNFIKLYRCYDGQAVHLVPLIKEDLFGFSVVSPDGSGVLSLALGGGIQIYDPMWTQKISDSIEKALDKKEVIPLWHELLLNAEQYLYQGDYRHSILESVIALEVVLSSFIRKMCVSKGISAKEANNFIKDVGLTGNIRVSLKLLLDPTIILGEDMLEKCKAGITIRNGIVHKGENSVGSKEANDTIINGRKLINIMLPFIN